MASNNKSPPLLSNSKSYNDWLKLIDIWRKFTTLEPEKQGPAIVLSLQGEAQDAILELDTSEISGENGVDKIIERLNRLYKKDELTEKYNALEAFETYKRNSNTSIREFLTEFEKRYHKTKSYGTIWSDDLLAYRLLKSANLTTRDEQLVKATIGELKYETVKTKLVKIFSDISEVPTSNLNNLNIKSEPTFHTQDHLIDTVPIYNPDFEEQCDSQNQEFISECQYEPEYFNDTFYNRNKESKFNKKPKLVTYNNTKYQQKGPTQQYPQNSNWRIPRQDLTRKPQSKQGKNPLDKYGNQTKCAICHSINHWAHNCPDRESENTFVVNEVILHQSDYDNPSELKYLMSETWSSALLDCGASKTVCGKEWLTQYINNLNDHDQQKVCYGESNHIYRFGDGRKVNAIHSAKVPAMIGSHNIEIETDVVDNDIPLLFSKSSMKKANMKLNFEDDTITIFNENIPLITTNSGHYAIPITRAKQLINNLDRKTDMSITLTMSENNNNHNIALKLHRQFAHPSKEKLLQLIKNAGEPWCSNQKLKAEINEVSKNCPTCKLYKKAPPRPVVGLPMATEFQETVAMDLKFYNNKILLHLIDHSTRLSASSFIPNKNPDTILTFIFKIWISIYGAPQKFLTDNGGEFANSKFIDMAKALGITVKTTAGESPWSNGLVERHNLVLSEMLDKVLEDTQCHPDLAVSWCINAKNSLHSVHGFSPYQLAIGKNPKLPSTLNENAPALTRQPVSKIVSNNLEALHKAREAFIASENSEKIRRALAHNIRTSGDIKYVTGDSVYYKRMDSREWHGPAKVLGQDGQQVLVKNGSIYVRVHPCRLQLVHKNYEHIQDISNEKENQSSKTPTKSNDNPSTVLETSDSEDENDQLNLQNRSPRGNNNINSIKESNTIESSNLTQENKASKLKALAPKTKVKYQVNKNDTWESAEITSRAAKATGKNRNWWNIKNPTGQQQSVNFEHIHDFEIQQNKENPTSEPDIIQQMSRLSLENIPANLESSEDEKQIHETLLVKNKCDVIKAKHKELEQWNQEGVYSEQTDEGQDCISLRWVLKEKIIDGEKIVKARLCARGFEEEQCFRTDSPTCCKEGLRLTCCVISSNKWLLNSLDVKTAFLQGKLMERTVYVRPPKEAQTDKVWKLRKCIYGLSDASRYWYLKLREELIKLGATPIQLDQGIFIWHKNNIPIGIMACFVDDVLWGGNTKFENTIKKLKQIFFISAEHKQIFDYIGIRLEQKADFSIIITQKEYINSITPIPLTKEDYKNPKRKLSQTETTKLRGILGKLNWVSGMTRPEISFFVCETSTRIKDATISDLISANKIVKFIQNTPTYILIPNLHIESLYIKIFADASFNNLPNGGSQGGFIVLLSDKFNNIAPIAWSSIKLKRVARSTLAAETLALTDGCDTSFFIASLAKEIIYPKFPKDIAIEGYTDNHSLYETLKSTNSVLDRRLRVEISALREMCENNELSINWIEKQCQLSDVLPKTGTSPQSLIDNLQKGKLE